MNKSELDLSNLENSIATLKTCTVDYNATKDVKMKEMCAC